MIHTLSQFLVFGCFGLSLEVLFWGIFNVIRQQEFSLEAKVSFWRFLLYGFFGFSFELFYTWMKTWPWFIRLGVITLIFLFIEFLLGSLIKKIIAKNAWSYSGRMNFDGQTQLWNAPLWFALAWLLERYSGMFSSLATVITRRL